MTENESAQDRKTARAYRKIIDLLIAACCSAIAMIMLLASSASSDYRPEKINGATDPDRPIGIIAGEEFTICLPSNATTGYKWRLAKPVDGKILMLVKSEYRLTGDKTLAGSRGIELWTFRALSPGKTTVALHYIRPWEKDTPPAKTSVFNITVIPL